MASTVTIQRNVMQNYIYVTHEIGGILQTNPYEAVKRRDQINELIFVMLEENPDPESRIQQAVKLQASLSKDLFRVTRRLRKRENLHFRMHHGTNSMRNEKKLLKEINAKGDDNDHSSLSVDEISTRIRNLQWGYYPRNMVSEKQVLREIDDLKLARDKAIANAPVKGKFWNSLPPKNIMEKDSRDEDRKKHLRLRAKIEVLKQAITDDAMFSFLDKTCTTEVKIGNGKYLQAIGKGEVTVQTPTGLPKEFWAEVANTVVYVLNRSTTKSVKNITPFEAWFGFKPSLEHLKVFGCICYSFIPSVKERTLTRKSEACIFIGYSQNSKGYRVYIPSSSTKKIMVSRDVKFDEEAAWKWSEDQVNSSTSKEVGFDQRMKLDVDHTPKRSTKLLYDIYTVCNVAILELVDACEAMQDEK
ncbi:hypothetical protein CCACVL1_06111 [Corchorus capsularis]|uniref:Retroviral polymerase SH3-like domain-containing protein n=1 Tax=Corchorus capsularis TaxID=210143 RepID=A0A1R3JH83_COCAP|nr:hypothetical protein CCACVL1_06111 [Corchorus capsularis]